MQTKATKIIFAVVGVLILISLFYLFLQGNKKQITLKTSDGNVSINNPAELPDKKSLSLSGVNFKENSDYAIDYYPEDHGFIIAILNPNIQVARALAEKDFVQTLGISQADACKLKVSLSVPFNINETASGINYGLSFCPNGKAFPK